MSTERSGPKLGSLAGSRSLIFVKHRDSQGNSYVNTPGERSGRNSRGDRSSSNPLSNDSERNKQSI